MPDFAYSARDRNGHPQRGVLAAEGPSQLAAALRDRGWVVIDLRGVNGSIGNIRAHLAPRNWLPSTRLDVELGVLQLATMLRSGLTLLAALRTAAEQSRRTAMAKVWRRVAEQVEMGSTFADGLGARGRLFPPVVVQLVRVGEESGTLDAVLKRAATQLERMRHVRTTLLIALLYPAFVVAAAVFVTAFMVFSLIPKLQKFLVGRGRRLPRMSQILLDATTWMNAHATWMLVGTLVTITAVWLVHRTARGRNWIDRGLLHVPIIGGLLRLAGTATIARALSILLESGITLLSALQISRNLLFNHSMRDRVDSARRTVLEGGALAERFLGGREFTPMLGRMIAVGETTSTLGPVLEEVAEFHENQLAASVRRFSALIEPVTILIVGGIVGFIYIAFFMALFATAAGGR